MNHFETVFPIKLRKSILASKYIILSAVALCLFAQNLCAQAVTSNTEIEVMFEAEQMALADFARYAEEFNSSDDRTKVLYLMQELNRIDTSLFVYAKSIKDEQQLKNLESARLLQTRLDEIQFGHAELSKRDLMDIDYFLSVARASIVSAHTDSSEKYTSLFNEYEQLVQKKKWTSLAHWLSAGLGIAVGFIPEAPAMSSLVALSGFFYFGIIETKLKLALSQKSQELSQIKNPQSVEERKNFLELARQLTRSMLAFEHFRKKMSRQQKACPAPFKS